MTLPGVPMEQADLDMDMGLRIDRSDRHRSAMDHAGNGYKY